MSPLDISNERLYHDRTVQDWHRTRLPALHTAIDIDLCGYCDDCYDPLYVIESTTNPNKAVGVIRQLARLLQIPAFRVVHDTEIPLYAQQVEPYSFTHHEAEQFASVLYAVRRAHYLEREHNCKLTGLYWSSDRPQPEADPA